MDSWQHCNECYNLLIRCFKTKMCKKVSLTHAFMVLIYGYNFFVRVIYYLRYKLPDKLLETPLHYKETDIRKLPISTCAISVLLKLYPVLKKQLWPSTISPTRNFLRKHFKFCFRMTRKSLRSSAWPESLSFFLALLSWYTLAGH